MKEKTLTHILSNNDGYGEYETIIASWSNSAGVKRLVLVTVILSGGISNYFKLEKDGVLCDYAWNLEIARDKYNNIQ